MRQWQINPMVMCRQHLMGEHVEHHMFWGSIKKKLSMRGYLDNNLLEPLSLLERHDALVTEMLRRGYNHHSPLHFDTKVLQYLGTDIDWKINRTKAGVDLLSRCPLCLERFKYLFDKGKIYGTGDPKSI